MAKALKDHFNMGYLSRWVPHHSYKHCQHYLIIQVWAADDFEIFKRMMIQKNIELQLQALELLQQRYGVLPDSLQPSKKQENTDNENQVLEEIKRLFFFII